MENKKVRQSSWELTTWGGLHAGKSQAYALLGLCHLDGMSSQPEYMGAYGAWGMKFVRVLKAPRSARIQKGEVLLAAYGRLDRSCDGIWPAKNGITSRYFLEALYQVSRKGSGAVRLTPLVRPNMGSRLCAGKVAPGYRGLAVAVSKLTEMPSVREFIDARLMNS